MTHVLNVNDARAERLGTTFTASGSHMYNSHSKDRYVSTIKWLGLIGMFKCVRSRPGEQEPCPDIPHATSQQVDHHGDDRPVPDKMDHLGVGGRDQTARLRGRPA